MRDEVLDHIENTLVALVMVEDIPEHGFTKGLSQWQCGTAFCFGGWVARHPHFRKQGVRTQKDWWGSNEPAMDGVDDRYNAPDVNAVAEVLFGDIQIFGTIDDVEGKWENSPKQVVLNRLKANLERLTE